MRDEHWKDFTAPANNNTMDTSMAAISYKQWALSSNINNQI